MIDIETVVTTTTTTKETITLSECQLVDILWARFGKGWTVNVECGDGYLRYISLDRTTVTIEDQS